jgi:NAD(P)-dependent dehydrogenase (short-subunit alcohol dehydrogenase family)
MAAKQAAVITGGASGIGHATASRMAREGYAVVVGDIQEEQGRAVAEEITAAGGQAAFRHLDVASEDSVEALAAWTEKEIGPVEVLVNSAGLIQNAVTAQAMDMETHDRVWQVNYRGTYLCCRVLGDAMLRRGRGAIVNLASINSFRTMPLPAYSPGKAAVKMLTEILAAQYGRHGVRVNAVAPTFTMTPTILARIESGHRDVEGIRDSGALKVLVTPEDVANGIAFLCSPGAAVITGVTLPIDAGWLVAQTYDAYPAEVEGAKAFDAQ